MVARTIRQVITEALRSAADCATNKLVKQSYKFIIVLNKPWITRLLIDDNIYSFVTYK